MNGKKQTARKKAADVVERRHQWLRGRIDGWTNHIEDVKCVQQRILTDKMSTAEVVGEFAALAVSCWDTAFGWMLGSDE